MGDTSRPKIAGDKLTADEVNKDLPVVLNAGETIDGATLPVPVYVHTDGELYACDGNDTAKLNFIGFAVSDSTNGNPIQLQNHGVVSGFSGLTIGSKYYVQDDGTIGTSVGTYEILVGEAISETELLIGKSNWQLIGEDNISAVSYSGGVSDTSTIPSGTKFIVCTIKSYSVRYDTDWKTEGQVLLFPDILDSATVSGFGYGSDAFFGWTASISGSTLTLTSIGLTGTGSGTGDTKAYINGTIKYFR